MLAVGINVAASLALVGWLGVRGLALATSIAAIANGGLLLMLLRRRLGTLEGVYLTGLLLKLLAASAAMALVVTAIDGGSTSFIASNHIVSQAVTLMLAISGGLATLLITARLLGITEVDELLWLARTRWARTTRAGRVDRP
jgi:putative peptidoglycan lipid II flippase